jgi:hypothetical protein
MASAYGLKAPHDTLPLQGWYSSPGTHSSKGAGKRGKKVSGTFSFTTFLKELRNQALAHAEWSYHPAGVTDSGIINAMPFSIWQHFRGQKELFAFKSLASKVHRAVKNVQADELQKQRR